MNFFKKLKIRFIPHLILAMASHIAEGILMKIKSTEQKHDLFYLRKLNDLITLVRTMLTFTT